MKFFRTHGLAFVLLESHGTVLSFLNSSKMFFFFEHVAEVKGEPSPWQNDLLKSSKALAAVSSSADVSLTTILETSSLTDNL